MFGVLAFVHVEWFRISEFRVLPCLGFFLFFIFSGYHDFGFFFDRHWLIGQNRCLLIVSAFVFSLFAADGVFQYTMVLFQLCFSFLAFAPRAGDCIFPQMCML